MTSFNVIIREIREFLHGHAQLKLQNNISKLQPFTDQ
jgi:hypothetical protein